MRLGKVIFNIEYVVDLDNKRMVDQAWDWIQEDLSNIHDYDELMSYMYQEEDKTGILTERDIHSAMLDEENEDEEP